MQQAASTSSPVAATSSAPATVQASVVIRSYNRTPALCELLTALLAQTHASFEIVVVEQSTQVAPEAAAELAALAADPRVSIHKFPPLGGPRARNEGVRLARGEFILLMDDDDLPGDADWLANHLANYEDPNCLAVNGRAILVGGKQPPYANMAKAERNVMSLTWLGWQRPYAQVAVRKKIQSIAGGNVSLRRSAVQRAGLWDECTPVEDELSFAYRLRAVMRPQEYLVFDPKAAMLRRMDIPGGMNKRFAGTARVAHRHFQFLHRIIGHYFPAKYWLLHPVYVALLLRVMVEWIWSDSHAHDTLPKRAWATLWFATTLPVLWASWLTREAWRRLQAGPLAHHPRL